MYSIFDSAYKNLSDKAESTKHIFWSKISCKTQNVEKTITSKSELPSALTIEVLEIAEIFKIHDFLIPFKVNYSRFVTETYDRLLIGDKLEIIIQKITEFLSVPRDV